MLKKLLIYPIVFLITLALFLGYGFLFGGEFPGWLIVAFVILNVLAYSVFNIKKSKDEPLGKLIIYSIVAFVLVFLCVFAYNGVNEIVKTEVDSYEATVIDRGSSRGELWVTFYDPDGKERTIYGFDETILTPVISDDEVIDYKGQTVKVIVYSGLFGIKYLELDE